MREQGGSERRTHKRQYKTSVQLKNYTNKKQMGRKEEQNRERERERKRGEKSEQNKS